MRSSDQPEKWVDAMEGDVEEGEDGSLGLEKRAAWGLGRAPGVSRKETLAPTCSKKAGRLKGCFLVSYVFLRVTFRSQGLSTDSWGQQGPERSLELSPGLRSAHRSLDREPCFTDVCRECCVWRLWGQSLHGDERQLRR